MNQPTSDIVLNVGEGLTIDYNLVWVTGDDGTILIPTGFCRDEEVQQLTISFGQVINPYPIFYTLHIENYFGEITEGGYGLFRGSYYENGVKM